MSVTPAVGEVLRSSAQGETGFPFPHRAGGRRSLDRSRRPRLAELVGITDFPQFHPHALVTCTGVAAGVFCLRRAFSACSRERLPPRGKARGQGLRAVDTRRYSFVWALTVLSAISVFRLGPRVRRLL